MRLDFCTSCLKIVSACWPLRTAIEGEGVLRAVLELCSQSFTSQWQNSATCNVTLFCCQVVYNVKASIRQIETWGKVKEGYLSLLWYVPWMHVGSV